MRFRGVLLALSLLGSGAVAQPQPSPLTSPPEAETSVEVAPVVVTAQRQEALRQFARITGMLASDRQLARWDRRICAVALGLSAPRNAF